MFKVVSGVIAFMFVVIIAFWIFIGFATMKTVGKVEEVGLKSMIETIWCGKAKDCLFDIVK